MESMFQGVLHDVVVNNTVEYPQGSSFNQPIGNWDTREVTTMRSERQARPCLIPAASDAPCARSRADMFQSANSFDQPLAFNTSKVTGTGMERMFHSAKAFKSPLIGWDTSHVTSFSGALRLNAHARTRHSPAELAL